MQSRAIRGTTIADSARLFFIFLPAAAGRELRECYRFDEITIGFNNEPYRRSSL